MASSPRFGPPYGSRRLGTQAPRSSDILIRDRADTHRFGRSNGTPGDMANAGSSDRGMKLSGTIGNANYIDSESFTRLWNGANFEGARQDERRVVLTSSKSALRSKRPNCRSFDSLRYAPVAQDDSSIVEQALETGHSAGHQFQGGGHSGTGHEALGAPGNG
jgi:hypothetical protein